MAARGGGETDKLRQNVEEQMQRLLSQLEDLEAEKDNLEPAEYKEMYDDTIQQLKEFKASLEKMMAGNMTLVDQLSNVKMAIQAAVSRAFHTPEVIKLFAKKEPGQLRSRLTALQRDAKLGKVGQEAFLQQRLEILVALSKLGESVRRQTRITSSKIFEHGPHRLCDAAFR
eukprot:TRINITY_DN1582_c0_g1_i1.p1 TRINITY_DN1582_c0_g1~~TRINITY_DN1582_c0_g1_i1.p1  ORF type:complete len:171 (+),score=47.59 TRINITY_DN1582_c0_g1_i1:103-615(+)